MSATASDIITYIGVPLAVLGVLPIIYTCLRALLTHRSIRKTLSQNHHLGTAITRSSMMSGVVEIEMPRCTITPLDREYDADYWNLNHQRSALKGGSWTTFHWNMLVTGKKLYRCQYKDELRVPQAEVELDELVAFLLDRGAVPDEKGWSLLRTSGLWTPTGTALLRPPRGAAFGAVLRVAVPNDSDGVLSLSMHWQKEWDRRGPLCLPPFWMRLEQPREDKELEKTGNDEVEEGENTTMVVDSAGEGSSGNTLLDLKTDEKPDPDNPTTTEDAQDNNNNNNNNNNVSNPTNTTSAKGQQPTEQKQTEEDREDEEQNPAKPPTFASLIEQKRLSIYGINSRSTSVRFKLENHTIERVYFENQGSFTGLSADMGHTNDLVNQWFVYTASSLGIMEANEESRFWNFAIPTTILHGAKKSAVPCGLMVLLDILSEDDVPEWVCPPPPRQDPMILHQRFVENERASQVERTMPAAQAAASRSARMQARMWTMQEDTRQRRRALQEYEETRIVEGLSSTKLANKKVADGCLAWLVGRGEIPDGYTVPELARAVLYLMILDRARGKVIAEVCDRWLTWGNLSTGLNRSELDFLMENKVSFAYASSLVSVVEVAASSEVQVSTDMQECLKLWKKVRLG
ncbi:hypothetical protein AJ80_08001 [Polytolypa hystricis UAMH7299]|uniref:Uncharacterized protein n=1 Tax=Polytolypa hystricis (strain UAMH7299) TaxID=1447883 RepID=A0A2B7XE57_POLH7|nr:hypothetical protein AJ80_08001 [Polytolypa hystricis UAMH7299]